MRLVPADAAANKPIERFGLKLMSMGLLIDLPPAAGQPQEDLLNYVVIDGVIVVTTPQDLSLLDSFRSLQKYRDAGVPILGIVENMGYYICPTCGDRHEICQRSERWQLDGLKDVPVLGRIPLTPEISQGINRATPLMHADPSGPQVQAFLEIAATLRERIGIS